MCYHHFLITFKARKRSAPIRYGNVIHHILRRVGYANRIFEKVCSVLLETSPHMDTADVNTFNQLSINGVVVVVRIVSVLWNVVQIRNDVRAR